MDRTEVVEVSESTRYPQILGTPPKVYDPCTGHLLKADTRIITYLGFLEGFIDVIASPRLSEVAAST